MHNKIYISRRKQLIILDGGSAFVVIIHAYNPSVWLSLIKMVSDGG